MAIRFKDGSIPTDHELECIARAFLFGTPTQMEQFHADAKLRRKQKARFEAARGAA